MKVVIQKPDLDTCLTALLLGVKESDEIVVVSKTSKNDLTNCDVICIEAGGSGQVDLNNYDHHNIDYYLPPACRQAYNYMLQKGNDAYNAKVERLLDYVCMIDERCQIHPQIEFPSLSNIFSGMLLYVHDMKQQFIEGIRILQTVLQLKIDPYETMPALENWYAFMQAKIINQELLRQVVNEAQYYQTICGSKLGFINSHVIGGLGALYAKGCDVVVLYSSSFGNPPIPKYTIASNSIDVSQILSEIQKLEGGWGGHKMIIGSPREGSILLPNQILQLVISLL